MINNSRTAWPTEILMSFLSFSDNLLQDSYFSFQSGVDNFQVGIVPNMLNFGLSCDSSLNANPILHHAVVIAPSLHKHALQKLRC